VCLAEYRLNTLGIFSARYAFLARWEIPVHGGRMSLATGSGA
jgi:hypothetical protein